MPLGDTGRYSLLRSGLITNVSAHKDGEPKIHLRALGAGAVLAGIAEIILCREGRMPSSGVDWVFALGFFAVLALPPVCICEFALRQLKQRKFQISLALALALMFAISFIIGLNFEPHLIYSPFVRDDDNFGWPFPMHRYHLSESIFLNLLVWIDNIHLATVATVSSIRKSLLLWLGIWVPTLIVFGVLSWACYVLKNSPHIN